MHWFSLILLFYNSSFLLGQSLPLLLVVSLHGFRSDYSRVYGPLTNFQRLEQRGVRAHSMIPTFNTASIPNHYTLITGLHEEVHGVVSDQMYDRTTNRVFQSWANATEDWWPFQAIWSINEQRREARSGVIGWPQQSISVSRNQSYDKERPLRDIIDQMLDWFKDPASPINFGAIYFDEPGRTGFQTGPFSPAVNKSIQACDEDLGYLLDAIDKNDKLKKNLHLIVTSDHGLEQVNATNSPMYLETYVDLSKLRAFGTKTVINVFVNAARDIDAVFNNLSRIPHAYTYHRENVPGRYFYKRHAHVGDLIITLEPGYELHQRSSSGPDDETYKVVHGNAGYDNRINSMKTIFYASGQQLKENFVLSPSTSLYNVDLFPLMCLILRMDRCPASNGSLATVQAFLIDSFRSINTTDRETTNRSNDGLMGLVIYLLVLVSFVLVLIMAVVWSGVAFRNSSSIILAAKTDPVTVAEQNQYKFTQINDLKLNTAIGNDNL